MLTSGICARTAIGSGFFKVVVVGDFTRDDARKFFEHLLAERGLSSLRVGWDQVYEVCGARPFPLRTVGFYIRLFYLQVCGGNVGLLVQCAGGLQACNGDLQQGACVPCLCLSVVTLVLPTGY